MGLLQDRMRRPRIRQAEQPRNRERGGRTMSKTERRERPDARAGVIRGDAGLCSNPFSWKAVKMPLYIYMGGKQITSWPNTLYDRDGNVVETQPVQY